MTNPNSPEAQNPFLAPYKGSGNKTLPGTAPVDLSLIASTALPPSPSFAATSSQSSSASANARKSQILAISEMGNIHKPDFFLTTTPTVEGFAIQEYLGMVSIEIVVPKDLLFRNPAPHGDLHRLKAAEDELQKVKIVALEELSQRARTMGADGIVGMTLQFSQFDAIVCLCSAVGTAVKLAE